MGEFWEGMEAGRRYARVVQLRLSVQAAGGISSGTGAGSVQGGGKFWQCGEDATQVGTMQGHVIMGRIHHSRSGVIWEGCNKDCWVCFCTWRGVISENATGKDHSKIGIGHSPSRVFMWEGYDVRAVPCG